MKAFGEQRIAAGERCLVVDLEACTGMDSTFMGTLAGLASRMRTAHIGGEVQIADSDARNSRSLEDLGLDFLLNINPVEPSWKARRAEVREALEPPVLPAAGDIQRAKHVLEAHQVLANTSEKNARVFSNVVTILEREVAEKEKQDGHSD